ncbi:hypothetical protein [Parabacteroides sp. PFB2-10]|uniref:hypothetical protein n=1 Tax=Parabacteroides sp. PFB2-10 TaxID=1742405 RepID=UPI00247669A6|nr:hypothetical protein [Parabacteroides sp. PFB2-10]
MSTEKKENKEINKLSLLIVAIIVLVLIIGGAAYYIFHQQSQMKELVEGYELDKEMLADEYNEISLTYENIKFEFNNDSLAAQLATEQEKVKRLQEELRTVRATDTRRINELKKQLETLRSIMRTYVAQIDSLNTENTKLKEENKKVTTRYRQATTQAANLQKEKEQLAERVTLASKLDATNIQINPVNKKGKTVKKIKQMEQFVVSFLITKNITAPVGEKTIFVRIMKPDDDVLVKSRGDTFEFEGKHINYSMKRIIEYAGEETQVTLYWDIEEFLSPGTYQVDIFADGNHIGRKSFTLDN